MFQARFVLLAIMIPLAGVSALLAGTGKIHDTLMPPYANANTAAAAAAAGAMTAFSSATVDAAARAASDTEVRNAISAAQMNPKAEAALLASAGGRAGAPAFGLLIGADGAVIARVGSASTLPDSLSGFPVVAEALTGVARDGFWVEDGLPTHLAAAAVYDGGVPVGLALLGWKFTTELTDGIFKAAGTPIVIVGNGKLVGALPEGADAAGVAARTSFGETTAGPAPFPLLVPERTRFLVSALPLYIGDAQFSAVAITDRNDAFASLAALQLGLVGATGILTVLVLLIIFSTIRSLNRPLELITEHLSQVQQGNNVGILPEAGLGQMLRLGKQINMILQSLPSTRPGTSPLFGSTTSQDLPAPSGSFGPGVGMMDSGLSSPPTSSPGGFSAPPEAVRPPSDGFGMADTSSPMPKAPTPMPSMPPSPSMPMSAPPVTTPPPAAPSAPPSAGLAGLFDEGPDPLAAFRVPASQPAAPPPPAAAPPPPPPAPEPAPEEEMRPEATVMFQVPESLLAASAAAPAPSPAPVAPPPSRTSSVDDNRTVVAQVPQELLAQVSPRNDVDSADDAHYKEVYEKFVQTRIECGEDTSELSFDRFVAKLLKNRQQIVEKHNARSVRFQVYVKDGKAALRALPVRD